MKNIKQRKSNKIIKLRDDISVNIDTINTVVKTYVNPKTNEQLVDPLYVVYFTNGQYSWISLSEDNFNKNLKQYINTFNF